MDNLENQTEDTSVQGGGQDFVSDDLINAFKTEFGSAEDSSLTSQENETSEESETASAQVDETKAEQTTETPDETVQQDEGKETTSTEQENTQEFNIEEYNKLKEELEQLKKYKEETEGKTPEVDYEWFKSEEGRLWQMDLENVDITSEWEDLLIDKLVAEGFTEEEAAGELEDRYPELYDQDIDEDDKEYLKASRRVMKEARTHLEKLRERQKSIELPFKQSESKPQEGQIAKEEFDKVYTERLTQDYQQRANTRAQIADNLFKGKEEIGLKFGDVELKYKPTPEVLNKAKETLTHLENIGTSFADPKQGTIKEQDLIEFLLFKNDRQTLLDMYANVKVAEAKEQLVKTEIKNSNFEQKSTKANGLGKVTEDDPDFEIIRGLANGNFR